MLIMFSRQLEIDGKMLGWNLVGFASSQRGFSLQPSQCNLVLGVGGRLGGCGCHLLSGLDDDSFCVLDDADVTTKTQSKCFFVSRAGCILSWWRNVLQTAQHKFEFNRSFGFRFKSKKQPLWNTTELFLLPTLFSLPFHPHQNLACVLGLGQWWGCQPNFACWMSFTEAKRQFWEVLVVPFLYRGTGRQPSWQRPDVRHLEYNGQASVD